MSGQGLAQQVRGNAAANRQAPDAETQVREAIKLRLPTIKALLPDVLDERKLAALVITEVHANPELAQCSEVSLIGCVLRVASLGLSLGKDLGEAFLIPRNDRDSDTGKSCTLQIGYKGVAKLARRSGEVASITTRSVYAADHFEYEYGLAERLIHRPQGDAPDDRGGEQGPLTHAYAIVRYTNGGHDWEVLDRAQCLARKARGKGKQPAWTSDFAKMCEKSALLAMRARLPLTTEVATAFAQDGAAITVSTRGPAALVADHGDQVALEPPRPVDAATGEVDPPQDQPAPAEPEQIGADVAAVLDAAGINPPLHLAVIAKASQGRTTVASELDEREAHNVTGHARACAASPEGFVRAVVGRMVDGDEKSTLVAWLDSQVAEPS